MEVLGGSTDSRQVDTSAGSTLEDDALLSVPVQDGVDRVVDGEDEARRRLLTHALHADVEPDRRIESGFLGYDDVLQLVAKRFGFRHVLEVSVLHSPFRYRVDHAVDHLLERGLALRGPGGAAEVLLGENVGGVRAPADGYLHPELLEGHLAGPVVGDAGVAPLPDDLVVGVDPLSGEVSPDSDAGALWCNRHGQFHLLPVTSLRLEPPEGAAAERHDHKMLWSSPLLHTR